MFPTFAPRRGSALCTVAVTFAIILTITPQSPAQDHAKRLILKDGSYQLVTKYEVTGDRVRYLSAERDEWEELPKSLVDWPATDKYETEQNEKDRAAAASAVQLDKQIESENEAAAKLPEVAPGLRLPADSGVFLLDSFKSEPQLVEVSEAEGDISQGSKGNIFRGALAKQIVELPGEHAKVQSHVDIPSFYLNLEAPPAAAAPPQNPQSPQAAIPFDRFRIIRTQPKAGKRILAGVTRNVTGKVSQEQHFEKTAITHLTGGWLKLTPTETLPPGEYAVVEMTDKEGMNLFVWDFGINPNAPANANPWKPEAKGKEAAKPEPKPADQGKQRQ
jgi:hypothetical protein